MSVFTGAKIQPYRDSFDVVKSQGFNRTGILLAISDAEQAKTLHGTNLTKVAEYMSEHLEITYRDLIYWICVVNLGEVSSRFFSFSLYIYLKSDTADNMHILCTAVKLTDPKTSHYWSTT